jgi:hypothetical protein
MSKLKEADIPLIFTRYSEGASLGQLGKAFQVSKQVIHAVLNKRTWRHVSETLPHVDTSLRRKRKLHAIDIPNLTKRRKALS